MAYAPIAGIIPQYDEQDGWYLKFYKPETTTPIAMSIDSSGDTTLAKAELDVDGFPTTDGNTLFIPFINQTYDAFLFPTAAEADANDTINALRVAESINPFGDGFEQNVNYLSFSVTSGQVLLNVPAAPNGLVLVIDGDTQEEGEDFIYDPANGNITVTVAFTGNEQVFVIYGAIVAISGITVQGKKVFNSLTDAKSNQDLVVGDIFDTEGYHSLNDGGSATYKVVTIQSGVFSQIDFIPLTATGLFAQLIPKNNTVTLAQAGAKFLDEGAAGFDDTALQEALTYCADNGINLSLDGKEAHFYSTHQVNKSTGSGVIGFTVTGAGNSTVLRSQNDIVVIEFLDAYTYKNMSLKNFNLSGNGQRNDTGIKIRNWFESCSMENVFSIAQRYAFHILQSFNPSFYNCYARQAADRHAPLGLNDPVPSYGWWIDGSEGPINALYMFGCSAERYWHNRFVDNTANVGNFVSLEWHGGISQSAWQTGTMIKGGGAQVSFFGGYNENNWTQSQRVSDGSGVLADQGVNFTIQGITGADDFSVYQSGVYHQISQNVQVNAPIGNIMSVYGDSTAEEINFSSVNSRHGYNVPSVVDYNFYFDDGITTLNTNIDIVNSAKDSLSNVYIGDRYVKKSQFSLFGLDNFTDISTEPLSGFSSDNAVIFISYTSKVSATFTTAPVYVIQDISGATVGSVTFEDPDSPLSVTAGVEYIARVNLSATGVFRFARSVTSIGDNPDFNVEIFQKQVGFRTLVTYEE